jgi:hypothetical protein
MLVTFPVDSRYAGLVHVPAETRVVMPWAAAADLAESAKKGGLPPPRRSGIGHYLKPYYDQDLDGRTLLTWRGCGIGDQYMWSCLLRILRWRYPTAVIHHYCHPALISIYEGIDQFQVYPEPIGFARFCSYDYHLIGEDLCETDRESDQGSHLDRMIARIGLDPAQVPAHLKAPQFPLCDGDRQGVEHLLSPILRGRPDIVWQAASSNLTRAYPRAAAPR